MEKNIIKVFTRYLREKNAKKFIKDKYGLHILDIGCNDKHFKKMFEQTFYFGIDKKAGQDVEKGYLSEIKNTRFDYISMLAVIEHFNDHKKVLEECYRLLKLGGRIVLTTPLRITHYITPLYEFKGVSDHKRYFTKKDFLHINGFRLIHYSRFAFKLNQIIVLEKCQLKK